MPEHPTASIPVRRRVTLQTNVAPDLAQKVREAAAAERRSTANYIEGTLAKVLEQQGDKS